MKQLTKEEIKNIQLKILNIVANYCDKENLTYFLGYGTLLGAVRHQGYIPWDDDIDILMPRPDYEKFIRDFCIMEDYKVYSYSIDSEYPYTFAKVSYEKSLLIEKTDLGFKKLGVNIDIFPLDGLPSSEKIRKKIFRTIKIRENILDIKKISINKNRSKYKNMILRIGKSILYPISYKKIIENINIDASKYNYYDCDFIGNIVSSYGYDEIMPKEIFEDKIKLKFEGDEFYAPIGYDKYLVNIYDNYMEMPPLENRVTHHNFKAYMK